MTTTVYGIPNCDTVKKARAWLQQQGVPHDFHDYKKLGVPLPRLDAWMHTLGWEALLNRKGTTWRKLDAEQQAAVTDAASARALMLAQPSVIKRPVVEHPGGVLVGFDAEAWGRALA
ncbi:MAG: ArsC family reductase [Burkholderiales bacterium PBB1]|nr:MAG: ArsC family reductase [Burkholderiales bacterium PBB1]